MDRIIASFRSRNGHKRKRGLIFDCVLQFSDGIGPIIPLMASSLYIAWFAIENKGIGLKLISRRRI